MEATAYAQELNNLLDTVNEMTADSISLWHQTLAEEVRSSVGRIEQLAVAASQAALVQELAQVFNQQEQGIIETLEVPLRALRKLVDSGHLTESQKTRLLIQLGKTHDLLTQWDMALDQLYRALDYCADSLPQKAEALEYIGHIKSKQREYSAAESQYRASIEAYTELQNQQEVAHIHLCLGFNEFERDNYQAAEESYQIALHLAEGIEGMEQIGGDSNLVLAMLATMRGDFRIALDHYEQCMEFYQSVGDERGLSQAYYNMALLYVDVKEWVKAGESYQQSLEYAQRYSDLQLVGLIHLSRTELALQLWDLALAQASCTQAIKVFGELGCQAQLAEAYKYSGQIQHRKQDWAKAERLFQRSIQFAQECGSHLNQAESHYEYGLMLLEKRQREEARDHLNGAFRIFNELGARTDAQKAQSALDRLAESEAETAPKPRFKRIGQS